MGQPVVILGTIEPVIRQALLSAWAGRVDVRESRGSGQALADEARSCGARAVVVPPDDARDMSMRLPGEVLVVGLCAASLDALVGRGGEIWPLPNPKPESILALIDPPSGGSSGS